MNVSRKTVVLLSIIAALGLGGTAWGQSALPAEPGNFLSVTGNTANGDTDAYQVVFFEVPETVSGQLYFSVYDPGVDGATTDADPDEGATGNWEFRLIGGDGTLTGSGARNITLSLAEATTGIQRGPTISGTGNAANSDGTWVYFEPVSVMDGEKIGNKYYFKVFATQSDGSKNAFRLNVSYSAGSNSWGVGNITYGGSPTGVAGVRAFAYAWTLALRSRLTSNTWNLYPFVPDNATGDIVRHFYDFDSGETGVLYNKDGATVATGLTGLDSTDTNSPYPVAGQTNGTWRLELTEDALDALAVNTSMVYFTGTNPAENYRTYAAPYTPASADHVAISLQDGLAKSNGTDTETVTIQIVDADGNPVPYARTVYVTATDGSNPTTTNSARINGTANNYALITTNGDGLATFTVANTEAETVTINLETDGAAGNSPSDSDLPNLTANGSALIIFSATTPPSLSSASNATLNISTNNQVLPTITITENEALTISDTLELRIRLPAGLGLTFNPLITNPVIGGTAPGKITLPVSYEAGNTVAVLNVNAAFTAGQTITVSGLQANTTATQGTGRLSLSYDGGLTYPVQDSKVLTVTDTSAYVWWGTTSSVWSVGTNWNLGAKPPLGARVVIQPTTNQPVLDEATAGLGSLTIEAGATMNAGAFGVTVSGALTVNGTLGSTGTVTLNGTGGQTLTTGGTAFTNLTISGGTDTTTVSGALNVSGTLNVGTNQTLALGANNFSIGTLINDGLIRLTGDTATTHTVATVDANTGTFEYTATGPAAIYDFGPTDYFNLTVSGSGTFAVGPDLYAAGALAINAGTLSVAAPAVISAASIALDTAAAGYRIDANGVALTVAATPGIGLGLGSGAGAFSLTDAELAKIRAAGLTAQTSGTGTVTANGVTATGTANTGAVTLNASGTGIVNLPGSNVWASGLAVSAPGANISLGGDQRANTGNIAFTHAATLAGPVVLYAPNLTANGFTLGANSLRFSVDEIELNAAAIASTGGTVAFDTLTDARPINLRLNTTNAAGALDLNDSDLGALTGAYGSITIGRDTSASIVTLMSNLSAGFRPLIFEGDNGTADLIRVDANLGNTTAGMSISFRAPARIGGNITTNAGLIEFQQAVTILDGAAPTVSTGAGAGNITFAATVGTIDGNAAVGVESLTLNAGTGAVSLGGAVGATVPLANLTVTGGAALTLPNVTVTNALTVTASGAVSQGGVLSGAALTVKTLGGFGINLPTATNHFTGSVDLRAMDAGDTVAAAGPITYTDSGNVSVARILTASTVSLTATVGAISQTGAIEGSTLTTASTGGTVLNSANGVAAFTAANTLSGAVSLTNAAATLTLSAGGIAQYSGGSVSIANTGAVVVAGNIAAGTGSVTIGTGGTGTLTRSAGTISADTINLQTTAGSSGQIGTTLAPIPTAGTTTLTLGQGSALAGAYISHTGALVLAAPSLAANAPLSVASTLLLTLPAAAVDTGTGILSLSSGTSLATAGALSSSASISLSAGAGTLTVGHPLNGGTVTLSSSAAATLAANITTTGDNISLSGTAGVVVAAAAVTLDTGSGDPAAAGAINFGTVSVSGDAANRTLILDASTAGAAGGAVTVASFGNGGGAYLQNLTIDTTGATSSGTLTAPAGYALIIPGTTTIDIGTGNLTTLTNAANNFGTLSIAGAGAATVVDVDGIDLGPSALTGNLSLSAGNAVTDSGAVSVGGTASIATTANNGSITLDAGATFSSTLALSTHGTGDAAVTNVVGNLVMAASTVGGNLTLSADGAAGISDTGILNVAGDASFAVENGASVLLDSIGNVFTGSLSFSAISGTIAAVTLVDSTAVELPALTLTANLSVTAGGAITQTAATALVVGGTTTLLPGANPITLAEAGNDFGGAVGFTVTGANNVSLRDLDDITLSASSTGGSLTVVAGDSIGDSGTLAVTGAAVFETRNGAGAPITIDDDGVVPYSGAFGSLTVRTMDAGGTNPVSATIAVYENSATVLDGVRTLGQATIWSAGTVTDAVGAVLEAAPLVITSVGGATLDSANAALTSLSVSNTGSGAVTVYNDSTSLTVTSLTQVPAAAVLISNTGTLAISGAVTAPAGISLTAGDFDFTGTVTVTGNVALYPYSTATNIFLGGVGVGLSLTNAELNLISTAGTLTIGRATHTGSITVVGPVALTGPTGPVVLATNGGPIAVNADFATAAVAGANLTLDARMGASNAGTVAGAGQLTVGNLGGAVLTVDAGAGINLSNPANLAASVLLTNQATGNAVYYNNRNMTLSASNGAPGGTLTVVNATGTLATSGAVSTAGPGAAALTLQSDGALSLNNPVSAGGTGFVTLLGAGATQIAAGIVTAPGGLRLGGTGDFVLTQANVVSAVAAAVAGNLSLTVSGALAAGSVDTIDGITLTGTNTLTLNAAGALTQSQPITAVSGTLAVTNTAANTDLSTSDNQIAHFGTLSASGRTVLIRNTVASDQSGSVTASILGLSGTGDFTWTNSANNTATLAASLGTALLSYRDADAVAVGTAGAINGVSAGGFTLTAGGAVSQTQAIVLGGAGALSVKTLADAGANITLNKGTAPYNEAAVVDLRSMNALDSAARGGTIVYRDATGFDVAALITSGGSTLTGGGTLTDDLSQSGDISVGGTLTIVAGAGDAVFSRDTNAFFTVTATSAGALTLHDADGFTLGSAATTGPIYAQTTAGGLTVAGSLSTAAAAGQGIDLNPAASIALNTAGTAAATNGGAVRFRRNVVLGASTTIDTDAAGVAASAGNVSFDGTVSGGFPLVVDATEDGAGADGIITFASTVTGLTSLTASGSIALNGGAVSTITAGQTYNGPVVLGADTVFTSPAAQTVRFNGTLGGTAVARAVTVTTAGARFDGVVGGAGNLVSTLSVDGSTTLYADISTTGNQDYNGTVTLGASAALVGGAGTITFDSTIGQSAASTLTLQDGTSTGTVTMTGAVTLNDLAFGAGPYAVVMNAGSDITQQVSFLNTGNVTLGNDDADDFLFRAGMSSIAAGTNTFRGTLRTSGGVGQDISLDDLSLGGVLAVNAGAAGNFLFTGTVSVTNVSGNADVEASNAALDNDLTVTAALIDAAGGTLAISSFATADIGSSNFQIGTLANGAPATPGSLRLTGLQTTHAFGTFDADSGIVEYYGTGAGGIVFTAGFSGGTYWDLRIAGTAGGVHTLAGPVTINNDVTIIATGILDVSASDHQMTVRRHWINLNVTNFNSFVSRSGTVVFAPSVPIQVHGNNAWYIFECTVPGAQIRFQNTAGRITQRIKTGGVFRILGAAGNNIVLHRITDNGNPSPTAAPTAADDNRFWFFELVSGAALDMAYADVFYSNAVAYPVSVPPNVNATPYSVHFCYKWLDNWYAMYSYTEDSDYDGKIDRIRVECEGAVGNVFTGFSTEVRNGTTGEAYRVLGYQRPEVGPNFYILLEEKPYLDGGATLLWRVSANTSLLDGTAGDKYVGNLPSSNPILSDDNDADFGDWMQTGDTVWPIIGYTLSLPDRDGTFMHFSELVEADTATALAAGDFTGAGSFASVSGTGTGTKEALVGFGPRTISALRTDTIAVSTPTVRDLGAAPYWETGVYDVFIIGAPDPGYPPATGYTAAPSGYVRSAARPPFELQRGGAGNTAHRVTDVLVSVPPAAAADSTYFVWPVWARDSVVTELAESQYESLTGPLAASQTVGLVRDFTGTQWLRDQDITLQARVNPALGAPGQLSLRYDTNVPDASLAAAANGPVGLWLPSFAETAFSGIVPYPRDGTTLRPGTSVGSSLWNFGIDADDPKVRSVSTLDFYFTLDNGLNTANPLYVARLDAAPGSAVPADWYRRLKPFSFDIHDITKQRSSATILNNVIDPTKGERVRLSYQLEKGGQVTIQVFTLDGDLVQVLYRGNRPAGDYTASWDGKNRGGRAVARGMYFIRIVAPEIDEIRKVMVVK